MKLYLLLSAVLLLVQLASTDLRPNVVAKVLYYGDNFIAESVNTRKIEIKYTNLGLSIELENSTHRSVANKVVLQSSLERRLDSIKIAVEVFAEESVRGANCFGMSELHLRSSIKYCLGNVGIREMTDEEISQILDYQRKQLKSKEQFRVVHEHDNIRLEMFGQAKFKTFWNRESGGDGKQVYVQAQVDDSEVRQIWLKNTKTDTPVEIVGHPKDSEVNCHRDSPDMTVFMCHGQISARRLK